MFIQDFVHSLQQTLQYYYKSPVQLTNNQNIFIRTTNNVSYHVYTDYIINYDDAEFIVGYVKKYMNKQFEYTNEQLDSIDQMPYPKDNQFKSLRIDCFGKVCDGIINNKKKLTYNNIKQLTETLIHYNI